MRLRGLRESRLEEEGEGAASGACLHSAKTGRWPGRRRLNASVPPALPCDADAAGASASAGGAASAPAAGLLSEKEADDLFDDDDDDDEDEEDLLDELEEDLGKASLAG